MIRYCLYCELSGYNDAGELVCRGHGKIIESGTEATWCTEYIEELP